MIPVEPFRSYGTKRHNALPGCPLYEQARRYHMETQCGRQKLADTFGLPIHVAKHIIESKTSRTFTFRVRHEYVEVLHRAAKARKMAPSSLMRTLVEAIAEEDMFDAVLDDGVHT